tara:strand:- start:6746 stop:8653 length:1908 start_codon:yes stop_codon:yes gene_type:complete
MPSYFQNKRNKPLGGGINPRAASNRGGRKYNLEKATSFVSGGRRIGDGVTASAKNNIVGFKRAGVRGSRKGLDALVRAISSNIVNNIENTQSNVTNFAGKEREKTKGRLIPSVQRQTKNITRVVRPQVSNLNNTVNNVRNQSFNTIKAFRTAGEGDRKEDTGLRGIFGRLKDGFGLLKLLTNKRTQETLSKSIQNLEQFFTDSYRVALRLRKNLLKIFKALRRIRGGGGAGAAGGFLGGIGAGLGASGMGAMFGGGKQKRRRARPRRRGRGRAGLMLGLGAGALGMGMATNALAGESPQIQSAETAPVIPEGFIDRFQGIVEKFGGIINNLLNAKPKPSPGGGSGASPSPTSPGSTDPVAGSMSLAGGAETNEEKAWLKTIRKAEGTAGKDGYGTVFGGEVVPELAEGKMTVNEVIQLQKTGKMPERFGGRQVNYGVYDGSVSGASGAYQFMPKTLEGLLRNTGTSGDTAFTPLLQDQFALELLRGEGVDPTKRATLEGMNKAQRQWAGLGTYWGQTTRTTAESLRMYNTFLNNSGVHTPVMPPPAIDPSGDQSSARSLQSRSIARTAASQRQTSGPTIIPMNLGSQQQTPAPAPSSQPIDDSPAQRTTPIPSLPAGDSDNFFAMSAKLAYNIVE